MPRAFLLFTFLAEVPCQTSCPGLPLPAAWANHHQLRFFFFVKKKKFLSFLFRTPAELLHMCRRTSTLHCVLCTSHIVSCRPRLWAWWCQCVLVLLYNSAVRASTSLFSVKGLVKWKWHTSGWDRAFSVVDLCQPIGHPMHGHLLGLLDRSVWLLMVFRARSFDRVHRLLQYNLLECLRSEQQHDWMVDRTVDPYLVLWEDQFQKWCRCASCGERKERSVAANFFCSVTPLHCWGCQAEK